MVVQVEIVLFAAAGIGIIHSFAPDHYIPFVAIGKSRRWKTERILLFSLAGGLVHVVSSGMIGFLILFGIDVFGLAETLESLTSNGLIFIGLFYALASLFYHHHHVKTSSAAFLILLSLAPCIPLIPLMLVPETDASLVAAVYGISTLATISALTYLTTKAYRPPRIFHGKEDFFTGVIIAVTGLFTHVFKFESIKPFKDPKTLL